MSGPIGNSGNTPNIGAINNASKIVAANGIQARTAEGLDKLPRAKDAVVATAGKQPAIGTGIATLEHL